MIYNSVEKLSNFYYRICSYHDTNLEFSYLVIANPISVDEINSKQSNKNDAQRIFSFFLTKVRDNVKMVKDNVDYLKYNIEKQPVVEKLKNIAHFDLIEENANYVKNQTLESYFKLIDNLFDNEIMNELMQNEKLNNLDDKLEILNNMRKCLVDLLQHTLYQNLNELIRVIATYINLIDSNIIKLELEQEVNLGALRHLIKDVMKFVQKFTFIFDDKDFKCENINIF